MVLGTCVQSPQSQSRVLSSHYQELTLECILGGTSLGYPIPSLAPSGGLTESSLIGIGGWIPINSQLNLETITFICIPPSLSEHQEHKRKTQNLIQNPCHFFIELCIKNEHLI